MGEVYKCINSDVLYLFLANAHAALANQINALALLKADWFL